MTKPASSPPPRRRWFRRALRLSLLLALLVGAGLFYATRPHRLGGIVAAIIEGVAPVDAHIDAAHLSIRGQLSLEGLRLKVPDEPPDADQLFEARQVFIEPDFSRLLRGRLGAASIVLVRPTLHLIEDLDTGRFNIQKLASEDDGDAELPHTLPDVFVRQGKIRFGEVAGETFQPLGELDLSGTLMEAADDPGVYAVVLRQQSPPGEPAGGDAAEPDSSVVLRGSLRLGTDFQAHASLEHFSLEDPHRNLLPRRLRDWWDQLNPRGSLPTVDVAYDADPAVGLQATIALEHGALRLPYGDFAPRMTDVSGRFVVRGDTITIDNLTGMVAGIRYAIDGQVQGFEGDAAFDLSARTSPFTLAQNPYWFSLLPPHIRKHYARFNPSGTFAAEVNLRRPERGGDLRYAGQLTVIDGRGAYEKFPYPLQNVRGAIRFSEQKVEIVDLRGQGVSGGELIITGEIVPPGDGAAVDMRIAANHIPIDRHLLWAMEDRHRKVVDIFLNQDAYDDLIERELIRSAFAAEETPAGASSPRDAPPVFDLGGTMSAVVEVKRAFGPDARYRVTTTLDTTGAGMLTRHWPYPLISTGGKLIIGPDDVIVENIRARGLTGGQAIVDGVIDRRSRSNLVPDIALREVRLPIDELLLASLPQPQDQWVRRLGARGLLVGEGRVFNDDTGDLDFILRAELVDGSADPFGAQRTADPAGPFTQAKVLGDVTGAFTVSRSHLALDRLAGRSGDTTISVSGDINWAAKPVDMDLRISGAGLTLGPHLLALLPEDHPARVRVEALLATYAPQSRFAGELDYHSDTGDRPEDFTLTLLPQNLAFDWQDRRVQLDAVAGAVVVRPGRAILDDVTAALEHGELTIAGRIPFGGDPGAPEPLALRLAAHGDGLDENGRALLPQAVVDVIDNLQITGEHRMVGTVVSRRTADGAEALTFNGTVGLRGVAADIGAAVTDLEGELAITAVSTEGRRWPELDVRLTADRLRVADRLVEMFTLHLANGEQPQVLDLREMIGTVYGGTLVGRGSILLGDPGRYQFDVTLEDAAVDPMISPLSPSASAGDIAGGGGYGDGSLSASLALEATAGDPSSRSGRGAVEVRDARLYDKPLTMAILQAASLSLPTHRSFDRVSARYLVDGDTVRFDSLRLESPTVAMIGVGTLDYAQQQLDLALVTRNPGAPSLGALSEMLNVFKDELVTIEVTGPIADPQARLLPFEGLRASWNRIFGRRPDTAPLAPEN